MLIIILIGIVSVLVPVSRYLYERKENKKTNEEALYTLIMDNSMFAVIGAVILFIIMILTGIKFNVKEIIDVKTISTIIITAIAGITLMIFRAYAVNKLEDSVKLTRNYQGLIKKYPAEKNWFSYTLAKDNLACLKMAEKEEIEDNKNVVKFPVIVDAMLDERQIEIIDNKDKEDMYDLPDCIKPFEAELFKAHDTSHIYNQLNVRVKNWEAKDDKFIIETERTTYFKSMVTNRAIDFRLKNEMTVRDLLQYGPFVPPLKDSLLSNHLGFNGFIVSSIDRVIPLVKRKNDVSIGKNAFGPSISASLKTMYCLDEDGCFTVKGLIKGIREEIADELKIQDNGIKELDESNIIAAYRDIVEGNKPQLLFYCLISKSKEDIDNAFKKAMKEKHKRKRFIKSTEEREKEDGSYLKWIEVDKLKDAVYLDNCIIYEGERIKSVPSSIVSLMLASEPIQKKLEEMNKNEQKNTETREMI